MSRRLWKIVRKNPLAVVVVLGAIGSAIWAGVDEGHAWTEVSAWLCAATWALLYFWELP